MGHPISENPLIDKTRRWSTRDQAWHSPSAFILTPSWRLLLPLMVVDLVGNEAAVEVVMVVMASSSVR